MEKVSKHKKLLLLLCAVFVTSAVFAQVTNSKHDFQNAGWNASGEICVVCHTPHNADAAQPSAPLWNHETTTSTFTLYNSPTLDVAPEQPQASTRLCLSCHDGTVAMDSFGGNTGATFVSGAARLETDLSDDHPVGVKWEHQVDFDSNGCDNCHSMHPFTFVSELPFFNGYIECATCHDVHDGTGNEKMLRKPLQNSALCLHCHGK